MLWSCKNRRFVVSRHTIWEVGRYIPNKYFFFKDSQKSHFWSKNMLKLVKQIFVFKNSNLAMSWFCRISQEMSNQYLFMDGLRNWNLTWSSSCSTSCIVGDSMADLDGKLFGVFNLRFFFFFFFGLCSWGGLACFKDLLLMAFRGWCWCGNVDLLCPVNKNISLCILNQKLMFIQKVDKSIHTISIFLIYLLFI